MRRALVIVSVAALTLSVSLGVAVATTEGTNCASILEPVGIDDGGIEAVPIEVGCYDTYAEALAAGSDGAIEVPADTTPSTLTDAALSIHTTSAGDITANVLIGTEWTGTSYSGSSNSYFAASTCTVLTTWQVSNVGATWNDQFESGKGFGGCDTNRKYQDANFGGAMLKCTPNCSNYGSLADQVTSLRWRV
jgi:hypothetical protein